MVTQSHLNVTNLSLYHFRPNPKLYQSMFISMLLTGKHYTLDNFSNPGPLFTKRTDVLPQDLAKSRSRDIWAYPFQIALKFERYLGNSTAEMPVKFMSDIIIMTFNFAASIFHENLRWGVLLLSEWRTPVNLVIRAYAMKTFSVIFLIARQTHNNNSRENVTTVGGGNNTIDTSPECIALEG